MNAMKQGVVEEVHEYDYDDVPLSDNLVMDNTLLEQERDDLEIYLCTKYPGNYVRIEDFWKSQESSLPDLARFAKFLFSLPGGNGSAERTFSHVKNIVQDLRTSLDPSTLNTLIIGHSLSSLLI